MSPREFQEAFEYTVNKYDEVGIVPSDTIFYWLNTAIIEFVEVNYSNEKESFEETQKVTDVLKNLVVEESLQTANYTFRNNSLMATLPEDYLHAVNEEVKIQYSVTAEATEVKRVGVTDSSSALLANQLADPYSPYRLHYRSAKPLRLFNSGKVILITDGNYTVLEYYLRYLRNPALLVLSNTSEDYKDLPKNVHRDIVKIAASLYLRSVGVSLAHQPKQQESNK